MAVAKENVEILKLLLAHPKIDVNIKSVLKSKIFYVILIELFELHSKSFVFNTISNNKLLFNSKFNILITF